MRGKPAIITIGGDVILGQRQAPLTARRGPADALSDVAELATADLSLVTLECVIATRGEPVSLKPFSFRGRPELLAVLTEAGIDVVATANNHSGDYGKAALHEQGRLLDAIRLAHCGSGQNRKVACSPVVRRAGDLVVAVFSVDGTSPSYAAGKDRTGSCFLEWSSPHVWRRFFAGRIRKARKWAHFVIVVVHYGMDFTERPSKRDRRICRALIDAEADVVVRTSTHMPQGVEIYQGRPIIYDPGTLLWGAPDHRRTDAAVHTLIAGPDGARQLWVTPIEVGDGTSRLAIGERARAILTTLQERSADLGTSMQMVGERGLIDLSPFSRRRPPAKPVPVAKPVRPPPAPVTEPPRGCVAPRVPPVAKREPLMIGPLTLIGALLTRAKTIGPPVFLLDCFWTVDAPIAADLWLSAGTRPPRPQPGPPGWSNTHEPCDAQWPTSRWRPGEISRDRVILRPGPDTPTNADALKIWLGVYDWDARLGLSEIVVQLAQ